MKRTEYKEKKGSRMWSMIWPVALVVLSNTFYNICQKSTPEDASTFGALTVTYLVATVISATLFLATEGPGNALTQIRKLNWTSIVLGIAIIGLEAGYLFLYRAGWKVSVGSVVCNIALAVVLIFVGWLLYKETITPKQLIGIAVCGLGLYLVSK